MKEKILIVEDDREINELLNKILTENNYLTTCAFNGAEGLNAIYKDKFDLIILDILLPFKSGDQILRELRKFSDVPVIVLSAKSLIQTKVDLLKLGADDYITKPFDLDELLARAEANLRRYKIRNGSDDLESGACILKYKNLVLDKNTKKVTVRGIYISFTAKEYKILELLLSNQDKVFSKANLYESVWNEEYFSDDNILNTHMSNIRIKLKKADSDEKYIETVWGLGYRLCRENGEN